MAIYRARTQSAESCRMHDSIYYIYIRLTGARSPSKSTLFRAFGYLAHFFLVCNKVFQLHFASYTSHAARSMLQWHKLRFRLSRMKESSAAAGQKQWKTEIERKMKIDCTCRWPNSLITSPIGKSFLMPHTHDAITAAPQQRTKR